MACGTAEAVPHCLPSQRLDTAVRYRGSNPTHMSPVTEVVAPRT